MTSLYRDHHLSCCDSSIDDPFLGKYSDGENGSLPALAVHSSGAVIGAGNILDAMQSEVAMRQQDAFIDGNANIGIAVQLAISCGAAGAAALGASHWLSSVVLSPAIVIVLAMACAISVGLLLTAHTQYALFMLHLNLIRLAEGRPVQTQPLLWQWPLRPLFDTLSRVSQRVDAALQREQLNSDYQQRLLQQASEVAAAEERNRIARELHDSIKQQLFSIRMSAVAVRAHMYHERGDISEAREALEDIQRSAGEAQIEMQALLQQLSASPLGNTSLAAALHTQAEALGYRSGAQVHIQLAELPSVERFPPAMQETLFRIIQEGFANIARHARARQVWCTITQCEDVLEVVIKDDGQGFDVVRGKKGMGLANIEERALSLNGRASIESRAGQGTTVRVTVPLLLPLETKQQKERQELEAQRMLSRAQGRIQLSATMASCTLLTIVVTLVLLIVRAPLTLREDAVLLSVFCLSIMLYGLISARPAIAHITIYRGQQVRETLGLHSGEQMEWTSFLRLFLLVLGYILLTAPHWHVTILWFIIGLVFLIVLLLFTLTRYFRSNYAMNRYYALLQKEELTWEVRWRERVLQRRIILYIAVGIFIGVLNHFSFWLPRTPGQWLASFGLMVFVVLWIGVLIDCRYLLPWYKLVRSTQRKPMIR